MKKYLFTFLLFAFTLFCYSQNNSVVRGKIVNAANDDPMENVNIVNLKIVLIIKLYYYEKAITWRPFNVKFLDEIKRRFKRYNTDDRAILDTISIQFNSFFLNDSIWIKADQVISKIKPLQKGFNKVLLKKPNFIQLNDSLELYLIQINEVLATGSQAPIEYVLPTLRQIIINQRKLKLVGQLKNEIVNDAIKNKKFEIYE